jgi:probable F420-dependent oxidoreductase
VATEPGGGEAGDLIELAVACETAGVDGIVLADHVVVAAHPSGFPGGTFPFPPDAPFFEPLTMAAAIAARTTTLVLATGVIIVPLRPAALLAKVVTTVDAVAGGRLELGVGTGWQLEEYDAVGVDRSRRGELLTDHLRACRALWAADGPATVRSATTTFEDIWCRPAPVRTGGPPILFAGRLSSRTLDRVIELGDGWLPMFGASQGEIARDVALLAEVARGRGRSPADLRVRVDLGGTRPGVARDDPAALVQEAGELLSLGVTDVVVRLGPLLHGKRPAADALGEVVAAWRATATR